ncbi:hypothetical protein A8L34_03360 [Bacillus sp. FJAT-27264]|nr:hypothetical protein A8L34_03360 [Bacillus sp. FJAT-27264]
MLTGCILLLFLLLVVNLTQGQANLRLSEIIKAMMDRQGNAIGEMVWNFRLPRAVAGMLCGAALAVSGALLQTVLRNPLASAGTLGINAGAYFTVVIGTVLFPSLLYSFPIVFALGGGIGAMVMVYALAGGLRSTPIRIVLAGMIVTLLLSSFTSVAQILFLDDARHLFAWGSGSLAQNGWQGIKGAWLWIVAALCMVFPFSKSFDLLGFGEESAASLGQRTQRTKNVGLALAVLLATTSVSIAGSIGYVGLLAPHLVKLLGFREHRVLLPASAVLGAALLLGADALTYPFQATYGSLPVGAVTAAIGGPWLIFIVLRMRKDSNGGRSSGVSSMTVGMVSKKVSFPLIYAVLGLLLILLLVFGSLGTGDMRLSMKELLLAMSGQGDELLRNILWNLRLPRMAAAMVGGAALAAAGLLIQGAVRNPMADPSVIGVTSGAGAGVLAILAVWPFAPGEVMAVFAFAGAFSAAAIVFILSWKSGFNPGILILSGISVSAVGTALIQFLVLKTSSYTAALIWLAGSTYARGWADTVPLLIACLLFLPLAWWLGRKVELLAFDDSVSLGVGLQVRQTRIIAAGVGVALASAVVATVGTVGFIGLLAPHAARMLSGQKHRRTLILSSLIGAVLLTAADLTGQWIALPKEVPSGLMVALIGTPYLLFLLYQGGRTGRTRV